MKPSNFHVHCQSFFNVRLDLQFPAESTQSTVLPNLSLKLSHYHQTIMPRQSRSGGGSRRPSVAPSRPAPQQTRPSTSAAYPPARTPQAPPPAAAAPAQQAQGSAGPGLFGQMASTAAYVHLIPLSLTSIAAETDRDLGIVV